MDRGGHEERLEADFPVPVIGKNIKGGSFLCAITTASAIGPRRASLKRII
jgi:hypothetical protein